MSKRGRFHELIVGQLLRQTVEDARALVKVLELATVAADAILNVLDARAGGVIVRQWITVCRKCAPTKRAQQALQDQGRVFHQQGYRFSHAISSFNQDKPIPDTVSGSWRVILR